MEEWQARLVAIVESSDDAIVSKTLDGVVTSWNRAAERIFGWSAEEAVGRHITLIIPEERRAEEDHVLATIRRGDRIDHFETVRVTRDGRLIDISLTVSPIRDSAGRIVGASKIARDITERRRMEEARNRLLACERQARDGMPSRASRCRRDLQADPLARSRRGPRSGGEGRTVARLLEDHARAAAATPRPLHGSARRRWRR